MNEETRRKILADAESKLTKFGPKSMPKVESWMAKLEDLVGRTERHIKQICQAGGAVKPQDQLALRETIFTMLLQEFDKFDKEELMYFATATLADRLMQDVEANPWGRTNPDALGGQ